MNLYTLVYDIWETREGTTSDGFSDVMQGWNKKEHFFESESDDNAREQARKLLIELIQVAGKLKIRFPTLTRVVSLPKVGGIDTYTDTHPQLQYVQYYQD